MGKKTAAALLAASTLLIAACGDDGADETESNDDTPEATEDATGDTPEDTSGSPEEGEETAGPSGDFCADYVDLSRDWGYSDIRERPEEYGAALGALDAPDEISGDVQTVVDNAGVLGTSVGDVSNPEEAQALQDQVQEVQDATQAITDYVQNNCS